MALGLAPPCKAAGDMDAMATQIDAWVARRMQEERIPGVAVAVVRGGHIAHLKGYGVADANGRPVTPQTPFPIGSVTKPFTALAVVQLAEAGRIALDAPVVQYLPELTIADSDALPAITVRHLLMHTSGFSTLDGNRHRLRLSTADDALFARVRMLSSVRLSAAPGTRFEYSNANYQILGALIEAVTGGSYEDYIAEQIYKPLGMRSGFASTPDTVPSDMAVGHRYWFGHPRPDASFVSDRHVLAQALVVASAQDMAQFVLFNLGHPADGAASVLSPVGVTEMHDLSAFGYGLGWQGGERDGTRLVGHGGQNPGYFAFIIFAPERDEGVVALTNAADLTGRPGAIGIGLGLIDILNGAAPKEPRRRPLGAAVLVALFAMIGVLLLSVMLTRRRLRQWRMGELPVPRTSTARLLRLLSSLAFLAIGYAFLVGIWHAFGAPIGAGIQFAPDIAWLALVVGVVAAVWAVLRALLVLRALRAVDSHTLAGSDAA
jgi:CubicO group peptidase (beta-lactamase class C family)